MPYQKHTVAALASLAASLIFSSLSCQRTEPAAHASARPVVQTTPSPTPPNAFSNVILCPRCHGAYSVLSSGQSCPAEPSCPPEDPRVRPLPAAGFDETELERYKNEFQLAALSAAPEAFGGLTPARTLARGERYRCEQGLSPGEGRLRSCPVLVAATDQEPAVLIDTPEKFRQSFAPVDSAEEALAFAMALSGHFPVYEFDKRARSSTMPETLDLRPEFRYYSREFTPTSVTRVGNTYRVELFDYQMFGCGPHPYSRVTYQVSSAGEVSETSRTKLFEDPNFDGLCVD
jgi:hypothetical protein